MPTALERQEASEQVKLFFSLMQGLKPETEERSFKMLPGELLEQRYLMGMGLAAVGAQRLSDTCERMGMPAALRAALRSGLPEADAVHFGYEQGAGAMRLKVCLEFRQRLNQALAARPASSVPPKAVAGVPTAADMPSMGLPPVLLRLAYTWDEERPDQDAVAEYRGYPDLPVAGLFERLGGLYPASGEPPSLEAAERIINLALRRTKKPLLYQEVSEAGNPRASFDIRLRATELRVADLHPWLVAAGAGYGIAPARFDAFFRQVRERALGHLSGGTDRQGRDFLTVYHAVR